MLTVNAHAEDKLLGQWQDKSNPSAQKYTFKENQDFIHIHNWEENGKGKSKKSVGVWEVGAWTVTSPNGNESSCNLKTYADTIECCFNYKFIAKNLILTKQYPIGYSGRMCENKVLVKEE